MLLDEWPQVIPLPLRHARHASRQDGHSAPVPVTAIRGQLTENAAKAAWHSLTAVLAMLGRPCGEKSTFGPRNRQGGTSGVLPYRDTHALPAGTRPGLRFGPEFSSYPVRKGNRSGRVLGLRGEQQIIRLGHRGAMLKWCD